MPFFLNPDLSDVAIDRSIEYLMLSIGFKARCALLIGLGVTARLTARPGCMARLTPRGASSRVKRPICAYRPCCGRTPSHSRRTGRRLLAMPSPSELGDPVQGFGPGVAHPGQDRAGDLVLPAGDGPGQGDQLGNVVVLRAPVVEGGGPAADVPLAGVDLVMAARRFSASRSFSLPIHAARICCPCRSAPRMSMTLANCSGRRCSRLQSSRA